MKSFAAGIAVQTVFGIALGIFFLVWTLYMQIGLGWSAAAGRPDRHPVLHRRVRRRPGLSVQKLVPRFGRKVLQAGALTDGGRACCSTSGSPSGTASAIASWQMALPLVVMGVGMGLIVAPLTDAVLSEVPREHAGSASGLINTVQQMGNALGLGLVVGRLLRRHRRPISPRPRSGPAFVDAFQYALGWVAAVLVVIFLLMFALPGRAAAETDGSASARAGEPVR